MKDGSLLKLTSASDTKIVRFLKTKAEATPFDPKWDSYFEERDTIRMSREIKGKHKLNALFKQQKGLCPCCGRRITVDKGYLIHHGTDSNYKVSSILVHSECDKLLHAKDIGDELVPITRGL